MQTDHTLAPTTYRERILSVDVLRGFALFGILFSHMVFWYAAGALPDHFYKTNYGVLSLLAVGSYFVLFMGKFFSIFSFLFGLSFYLQLQSLSKHGDHPVARFAWRLCLLGVIGVLHHTFWRADILSIYVPLGFLLILFRSVSNRVLLVVGGLLVLNVPTILMQWVGLVLNNSTDILAGNHDAEVALYYQTINQDNFWQMCRDNLLGTYDKVVFQINTGRLLVTFGFFLLGMWVGRMGWFDNAQAGTAFFQSVWRKAWKVALALVATGVAYGALAQVAGWNMEKDQWAQFPMFALFSVLNTVLTFMYVSGMVLLMNRATWQKRLAPLAAIGKMALTSYLTQSVIGVFLFFQVGFGLFGKTTPAQNIGLCFVIFALQIFFSRWWLARFSYGPVEWLWRSATYLKWQPLVKR